MEFQGSLHTKGDKDHLKQGCLVQYCLYDKWLKGQSSRPVSKSIVLNADAPSCQNQSKPALSSSKGIEVCRSIYLATWGHKEECISSKKLWCNRLFHRKCQDLLSNCEQVWSNVLYSK